MPLTIQTLLFLDSLSPIVVLLQIFPFSTAIFTDIALRKSRILFPDPVFERVRTTRSSTYSHPFQVTIPNPRTLSHKSSFIPRTSQLLNCGSDFHPLLSLNPIICHLLNLTSANLMLSPSLLKLPHPLSFSFFGAFYRPYGPSPTLLTTKKIVAILCCNRPYVITLSFCYVMCLP